MGRYGSAEPPAKGGSGGVIVDHECGAARSQHALHLGQAGLTSWTEEVSPPGMYHVDAVIGERETLGGAVQDGRVDQRPVADPLPCEAGQRLPRVDSPPPCSGLWAKREGG